jgi:hypothetical protein
MKYRDAKTSRRDFVFRGGAAVGAGLGVAATAGAARLAGAAGGPAMAAAAPADSPAADREALRALHRRFLAAVEARRFEEAAAVFAPDGQLSMGDVTATGPSRIATALAAHYHSPHAVEQQDRYCHRPQDGETVTVLDGGSGTALTAAACFPVEVDLCTPLRGDSSLVEMARLSGHVAARRSEAGRFDATFARVAGDWRLAALRYTATRERI